MHYTDILLHLTADGRSGEKTVTALALARKLGARLTALYTLPFPMQLAYMGEYVPPVYYQQQIDDARLEADAAKAAFEAAVGDTAAAWLVSEAAPTDALCNAGRTSDIVVVSQSDPDRNGGFADIGLPGDLALALGRPVLVVPYAGSYTRTGHTVMIAWNGSREAARAVWDALPLLQDAASVIVLTIDPTAGQLDSAAALTQKLARQGIAVKPQTTTAVGLSTGDALLSALADHGVDLLVMGAYGHSRLRETVFGGVTDAILRAMTVPVLLSS